MQTPRPHFRKRVQLAIAVPAAVAGLAASFAVVYAYPTPPGSGSTGCTNGVSPGGGCRDTFTFGGTEQNRPVVFTVTSGVAGLSNVSNATDSAGRASVTVTADPSTCSAVQVTASTSDASVVSNVPVVCQAAGAVPTGPGNTGGGASALTSASSGLAVGASVAVLLTVGLVARRRRTA